MIFVKNKAQRSRPAAALGLAGLFLFAILQTPTTTRAQSASAMSAEARRALVKQYCAGCHNDRLKTGGFSFDGLDIAHPESSAEQFEKVILKLKTGMMPPSRSPRPPVEQARQFTAALEGDIDRAAAAKPNPGRPYLHRLNRTEYANAVRDLLAIDIDAESLLPADTRSQGFDNISEVLTVSPTLLESYVRAAGKISLLAVGDPQMRPTQETYRVATNFSQMRHVEGTPLGTRGGIAVVHNFAADGEYVFRLNLVFTRNTFLFGSTMQGEQLEVAVNGERVALIDIDPLMKAEENDLRTPPVKVKAGPQRISVSFIKRFDGPIEDFIHRHERSLGDDFAGQVPGLTNPPHLRDLAVMGPYNVSGVSDTPSRRRIFRCRPSTSVTEQPCAQQIVSALARQAFRRPLTGENVEELMSAYEQARSGGGFESGIGAALQFILASPEFVFRFERVPASALPGSNYRVSDLELASRLSFFLWSTAPDEELIAVAAEGKLKDRAVLRQQVLRMLKDRRSEALARNFAGQWLHLRNLKETHPDVYLYPDSDDNLFLSMQRETELLFDSVVREDRSVLELLTANYTFIDERLGKHYGIPTVLGSQFRRVTLTDENRFGILGHGSVLTVTSFPNRTSPVSRGKWILEQILGISPPVPPPNVPLLEEINPVGAGIVRLKSVRERLEQHRKNEPCASCHRIMDPLGLSLENFDAIGVWRTMDSGFPVDASGELADGSRLDGPAALRGALLRYSDAYIGNFTTKLLTYALGRGITAADMPVVREINRAAAADDHRFASIVLGIVNSTPFQMRRVEDPAPGSVVAR